MRRATSVTCFLCLLWLTAGALSCRPVVGGPRLVVVIVVDQMRADYLTRFADRFDSGLARLSREGRVFTDAHHAHAVTDTSPGHASISTGAFPGRCGIVGNQWWDRTQRRLVYSAEDLGAKILGRPGTRGSSPANLQCETLGDWVKAASPESKIVSIAVKDRPAVFLGGSQADLAYWFDNQTGNWVTSTYYHDANPDWVERFNRSRQVDSYFEEGWSLLEDEASYDFSREDAFAAEAGGVQFEFPHTFETSERPDPAYYQALTRTPFADDLTLRFVKQAVIHEGLGTDEVPDWLFVSLSAGDYIGHSYGPYSQEIEDHYLRLDRLLGDFLEFLEQTAGEGQLLVALTSDHGVLPLPEELQRRGVEGSRLALAELAAACVDAVNGARESLGIEAPIRIELAGGLVLLPEPGTVSEDRMRLLRGAVAERLRTADFIADSYTYEELADSSPANRPFLEEFRRSFHPERSPDVMFRLQKYCQYPRSPIGADHGSPYPYDTHVPIVLYGPGITPGTDAGRVRTVDLAPTLAELLRLPVPGDLDGRPLPLR